MLLKIIKASSNNKHYSMLRNTTIICNGESQYFIVSYKLNIQM